MASLPAGLEIRGDRLPQETDSSHLPSTSAALSPPLRGRGLYATRAFPPGSQIAVFTNPLVVLPASADANTTCNYCLDPRKPAKACTGCRAAAYCGSRCQKAHWSAVHKLECKPMREALKAGKGSPGAQPSAASSSSALVLASSSSSPRMPTPVRALLQILLQWPAIKDTVNGLESNSAAFQTKNALWDDFTVQAVAACSFAGWQTTDDVRIAETVLCAIHTNSFDRTDPDVGVTGTFLDATLAMANHSCVPNAVVVFTGRKAYLRAEQPIASGDEITISYIDYTKPKSARQKGLELYHFTCDCVRCSRDLDVYQVCRKSPLVPLNAFSFVPNVEVLRKPPLAAASKTIPAATIDQMYAECGPEVPVPPPNRLTNLRRMWAVCQPLIQARQWAVEPLAHIFQQAIVYYSEQRRFAHALAMECFVACHIDPYKYVAPFAQWRLKSLLLIAKTITNISLDPEQSPSIQPSMRVALQHLGDGSLYEAILLMVLKYGPMAHSEEWELLDTARDMLQDVQTVQERELLSAALQHWIKDPTEPAAANFFRQNILPPVETLASLAVGILKADLDLTAAGSVTKP